MMTVSVIVPIYNVEMYLKECINSILSQTVKEFELLLIDDGSIDCSSIKCDECINADSRITVIHKKNCGVSSARNTGINIAKGLQILFIDGDDTIKSDYIENMMIMGDEDIVIGSCTVLQNEFFKPIMEHKDIMRNFGRYWLEQGSCSSCWKCYSRDFLLSNCIRFEEEFDFGEDERFVINCLQKAKCIRRIEYDGYIYNQSRPNSAMKRIRWNRLELEVDICKRLEEVIDSIEVIYQIRWLCWHFVLVHYNHFFKNSDSFLEKKKIKKRIIETYKNVYFSESINYIKDNGSLDQKIEAYLMGYYKHRIYKPLLLCAQLLSRIKHTFIKGNKT